MLCWALQIGVQQLVAKGPVVLTFFTVWNWWLLTLFFFLASLASLRALWRARRGGAVADRPADALEKFAVVALAVEAPVGGMVAAALQRHAWGPGAARLLPGRRCQVR